MQMYMILYFTKFDKLIVFHKYIYIYVQESYHESTYLLYNQATTASNPITDTPKQQGQNMNPVNLVADLGLGEDDFQPASEGKIYIKPHLQFTM